MKIQEICQYRRRIISTSQPFGVSGEKFDHFWTLNTQQLQNRKNFKTEYFIDWILLNISIKWIMNRNSVSGEICRILWIVSNSKKFEITPLLITYAEVEKNTGTTTNQIEADHMTSWVGIALGYFWLLIGNFWRIRESHRWQASQCLLCIHGNIIMRHTGFMLIFRHCK